MRKGRFIQRVSMGEHMTSEEIWKVVAVQTITAHLMEERRRCMTMWKDSIAWMCMCKDIRHKGLHVEKCIVELRCAR